MMRWRVGHERWVVGSFNSVRFAERLNRRNPAPHEEGVGVTKVEDVRQAIEVASEAFLCEGLDAAWTRVIAAVMRSGVKHGDDRKRALPCG